MSSPASTIKGKSIKGKSKAPSIMQGKRAVSLKDQVGVLAKRIKRQEGFLEASRSEMKDLQAKLEKKKKFDAFVDALYSDSCMICRSDLRDCVGEPHMAIVSYECGCSKLRVVHLGCCTRTFRCACGQEAKLQVKSPSGVEVKVMVSEVMASSLQYDDDQTISDDEE